jgi:hypothetical protein
MSVEDYLIPPCPPDREYRDGVLVERNAGGKAQAFLQVALGAYL